MNKCEEMLVDEIMVSLNKSYEEAVLYAKRLKTIALKELEKEY